MVPATHRRVFDFSRDGILRSLAGSIERLGADRLDVVYLHDPDDYMADAVTTGYPTLAELRQEGVVRAIGAGMNDAGLLARLVRETDVDVVMLAGRYTLLEQESLDDLLPLCSSAVSPLLLQASSTADSSRNRALAQTRSTTTRMRRPTSSNARRRSRPSASVTARASRPPRSRSRSRIRPSSASASAPAPPPKSSRTWRSTPGRWRRTCGRS